MPQLKVRYLNPLLSAANSSAIDVTRRHSHLIKSGRQRKASVVDAGRVFVRTIVVKRVDVQSSLKGTGRFTAVIHNHAGNIDRGAFSGGRFTAGPRAEGGFAVRAELPVGQNRQS